MAHKPAAPGRKRLAFAARPCNLGEPRASVRPWFKIKVIVKPRLRFAESFPIPVQQKILRSKMFECTKKRNVLLTRSSKVLGHPLAIFDCHSGSGSYFGVSILSTRSGRQTPAFWLAADKETAAFSRDGFMLYQKN